MGVVEALGRGAVTARRFAVGVGCRTGVATEAVVRLVTEALDRAGAGVAVGLFTMAAKAGEPALGDAAERLGLPLVHLCEAELKAAANRTETRSERVIALFGVPSVAEAAALAGAGGGSRLVVARIAADGVTAAVAEARENLADDGATI